MGYSLKEYQEWVERVSSKRVMELELIYPALGLAGETGEVVERVKKIIRDREGQPTEEDRAYLELELGDVLWYIAKFCNVLNLKLDDVITANVDKINDRKINGKK